MSGSPCSPSVTDTWLWPSQSATFYTADQKVKGKVHATTGHEDQEGEYFIPLVFLQTRRWIEVCR